MAATGGHYLQQQKPKCVAAIRNCINNDLKELCKAYNYQVSGTKAVLQTRCFEILDNIVNSGDLEAFNDFQYRVLHHGAAPQRGQASLSSSSNYPSPGSYHTSAQMANRPPGRMGEPRQYFKPSPFYEMQEAVLHLQDLPEMPQNRNTVRVNLVLSADQVSRLKSDPALRLLMYCGQSRDLSGPTRTAVDVAFPNQIEVKINGDEVKSNFKGLKNKPGSTKPADITNSVRKANNYPNQVAVTYALTKHRYSFMVYLARHVTADVLTERIKTGKHGGGIISKQKVLDEMNAANSDPDIAATSVRMSLKDPISTLRITLPVRSARCAHNQCFDGSMFIQLQDQAPQWSCPVCSKSVSYSSLCVDKYFEEILQQTPSSIEKVDIEPNGEWRIIKEEEDVKPAGHSSKGGRASYDDDFDDEIDLVEVTEPKANGKLPGLGALPSLQSPMPDPGFPMNTPPLSSRGGSLAPSAASGPQGNKRPASSVIDLTLDDEDEDQPPRSAKRHQTGTSSTTLPKPAVSSYSTHSPLPDHRSAQPYTNGQSRGTDNYRPSSAAPRPTSAFNGRTSSGDYGSNTHLSNGIASSQGSPYRAPGSISPAFQGGNSSNGQHSWNNQSRPPSGHAQSVVGPQNTFGASPAVNGTQGFGGTPTFQPFSLRPHGQGNSVPQSPRDSYRLPPIMQPPNGQNSYGGG